MAKDFLTDEEMAAIGGQSDIISDADMAALEGQAQKSPVPKMATEKAARAGIAQGVTLGYTPQITGGGATLAGKIQDLIQGPVIDPKTGQPIPRVDYTTARDATTAQIDKARKDKPVAFYGGQIAGSYAPGRLVAGATAGMAPIKQGIIAGGSLGALQNPGDTQGEINPAQLGDRAKGAGIGSLIGGTFGAMAKLAKGGSEVSKNIKDVKSGAMANRAADTIDDSITKLNETQIKPRSDALKELIRGKEFEVNPDIVKPVFPRLGGKMTDNLSKQTTNQGLAIAGGAKPTAPSRMKLGGDRALRLKRSADSVADFADGKPFDNVAQAKGEEANLLANVLRKQINADPEAAVLNDKMREITKLKNALAKREGNTPLEILQAKRGSTPAAVVDQVDALTNSQQLRNLGEDVSQAKGLIVNKDALFDLAQPLQAIQSYIKLGQRGLVEGGAAADKYIPQGTKESLAAALTPTNRKKKKKR